MVAVRGAIIELSGSCGALMIVVSSYLVLVDLV